MSYPADLKYHTRPRVNAIDGDAAEIGITDYAQQQLGDVVYVELPEVGQSITAGTPFGTVESVKATSELFAPMSGDVIEVNTHLKDHPETVNSNPHETWMLKIRIADPTNASSLMDSARSEALLS